MKLLASLGFCVTRAESRKFGNVQQRGTDCPRRELSTNSPHFIALLINRPLFFFFLSFICQRLRQFARDQSQLSLGLFPHSRV